LGLLPEYKTRYAAECEGEDLDSNFDDFTWREILEYSGTLSSCVFQTRFLEEAGIKEFGTGSVYSIYHGQRDNRFLKPKWKIGYRKVNSLIRKIW
jgi:hypothetical protein